MSLNEFALGNSNWILSITEHLDSCASHGYMHSGFLSCNILVKQALKPCPLSRFSDVHKKDWLSGHGLFANQPADTVSSLPSDRRLTVADNSRQERGTGTNRLSGHG